MSHHVLLPTIIAIYGLAFFVLGLSVAVRAAACTASFARRRLFGLAAFGISHGIFEWLGLANLIGLANISPKPLFAVAVASFLSLYWFALAGPRRRPMAQATVLGSGAIWCVVAWYASNPVALEILTRLGIGAPAAFAAAYAYAFDKSLRIDGQSINGAAMVGGFSFAVYGVLQFFSSPSDFFPAFILGTAHFESVLGVSVFLARVVIALAITAATLARLDRFDHVMRQELETKAARLHTALAASEAGLAKAQRIGNMGSWERNIVTNDLAWSDQIYRIFGLEPRAFGASYAAFLERVHPDDRRFVKESARRAIEDRVRYDIKHRIVLPSGEVRYVHEQGEVEYGPTGQPLRMIGTVLDITDQQATEDALRGSRAILSGVLAIAEEAIILADNEMRVTLFSRGAQRVFGYEAEEAAGLRIERLIPERFHSAHRHYVREFTDGPKTSIHMGSRGEVMALRKNGEEFPAKVSLSKLQTGGEYLYSLILRDVGPENAARDELLAARVAAEAANQAKSNFLANMSHELRTPLNAIIGFSGIIGKQIYGPVGSPKYLEYLDDINQSGMHLLNIINDILDISKIEAGKLELHEEAMDVSEAVGSCLFLVKGRAETGGVNLKRDLPDDIAPLYADKRKLKQILINLLSNAIKFTPAGGEVAIRAWSRPDAGYVFQVIDTGMGIALEDIPTALAPFKQLENDLNRKFDGTGLGLPLTKSLAEMHGGSLDLQSEVGVGTTVTVRFPAKRVVSKAVTVKAVTVKAATVQ